MIDSTGGAHKNYRWVSNMIDSIYCKTTNNILYLTTAQPEVFRLFLPALF